MKRNTERKGRWDDRFFFFNDRQFFLQPEKKIKGVSFPKKGYKAIKYSYCLGNEPSFGTNEGSIMLRFRLKLQLPKRVKV